MVPQGSSPALPVGFRAMSAPMRSSTRTKPMRASFKLTFSMSIALSGRRAAAHAMNAADEGSPGTSTSQA